ncbi:MAG TPA: protein kinase [Candidatus Sulfotelmatobacter sp.]|nr:protein kinase [Candidatus Sulfotelmatobacter sp.]
MEPERWRRVRELFHSALNLTGDQRAAFLREKCPDDDEVRKEVESLLSHESSAAGFIESPAFDIVAQLVAKDDANEQNADQNLVGRISPRFRLLDKLGSGGMGVVYKAEDTKLRRSVALKFLPPELSRDPQALERFQREAYAASALNHPNICTVYDVDEADGQPFIAMELLEGQTLERRIGAQPLPTAELLELAVQISDGLKAAHARGIIHRDIKPSNIFVTPRGQPKILDFGLAKLEEPETPDQQQSISEQQLADPEWHPNLILTRTGMAIGTAGYMSPEQIRGEELDVRTDLFSFGLVLYEMATGQHAFKGETGPELQNAIIEDMPSPVRHLNPTVPAKLENIIDFAIKKDRDARYQSAAEIRADLAALKRAQELSSPIRRWLLALGTLVVLLVVGASLWLAKRQPPALPELKLRQLTVNSFENRVTSGAISPDGRYLAYADINGMYIKVIQTGETRMVPVPSGLNSKSVQWEIGSGGSPAAIWFPDSTRFVANAHPAAQGPALWGTEDTNIWVVSIFGGAPQKLRDKAVAYAVSPVDSLIAFTTNKGRELWLMGPSGEQARKILETPPASPILGMLLTPDGRRIVYGQEDEAGGGKVLSRNLEGGPEVALSALSDLKNVDDFSFWLPDGRFLYSVREPGDIPDKCNFWTTRLDPRTGQLIDKPKRLSDWTGSCMSYVSATAEGKRVVFLKGVGHITSYLADVQANGRRILKPRHFPLSESSDGVADWSADGKNVILASNRTGNFGIYKQALNEETAQPLVTNGYGRNPRATPDGNWILYLGAGDSAGEPVMRAPIRGGPSQLLFTARPGKSLISCARPPSEMCAIAEPNEDRKQVIISTVDPLKGRGPELLRFPLDPNENWWFWDLSPDGARVAATRSPAGPIYILSVRGESIREIKVNGWSNLQEFSWAADGRGLFLVAGVPGKHVLLHVDLQGNARVLWENAGASGETLALPSPDGRYLAIQSWVTNGNLWMMENF